MSPAPALALPNATRIFTIDPSCAGFGETVTITGNGFGAQNLSIYVGGQETSPGVITGGAKAQVINAVGNRATFIVPATAKPGVSLVWAVNPGAHAGAIAFRVKQPEICGNQTDEDCDGSFDDTDVCRPVNHAPVANAGADQTQPVGTTVHLDGAGSSDPDGNLLTFVWTFVNTPAGSTATLSGATTSTPTFIIDKAGTYTVQLTVNDGALSHSDTVLISTSNSAPVAHAGADLSGQVGAIVTLDGSGSFDIDGDALTYQWGFVKKPATSTASLSDPTSVMPSFTIDAFGDYIVQLVVHDGAMSSEPAMVTISTLNSPPVADAGADQSAHVNETVTLDGSRSSDVDGNSLTYSWSLVGKPSGSTMSLLQPTTPTPSLTIDRAGSYVAQLIVNDGIASSAPDTVTISTVNSKPVAHAGTDQSGTVGTVIHLDGGASNDVDGDPLTYQWSLISQPAASTATLQNPTTVAPQFTLDQAGTYIVQLTVHDGAVASDPDTVIITTLNSKPVAKVGDDQSYPVGATVTLDGSGSSDIDGDLLTYRWSLTSRPPGSAATLSDPSAVQPTFVIDKPGAYAAQLIVSDGAVESNPATVTISTVNSKPIANPGPHQHGTINATITLNGGGSSDADGDPLTYQWSLVSAPANSAATLQTPTSVTTSFVMDKSGTYTVQLIVNDGAMDSDPATVTITTLNSKPAASAGPDQEVALPVTVHLNGSGSSDVDGDPLSYVWSFTARPEYSTATLSGETLANPTFTPDLPGTYVVQLIVTDGQLDSEPDTVTIKVIQPDTTPPPPADPSKITLSRVANGQTTLTGSAGSVEGGTQVRVTNLRSTQTVTGVATADGSFSLSIGAQEGDTLAVVVLDAAGNPSLGRLFIIETTPSVVITEPTAGAVLSSVKVRVRGTVQGPPNTGVIVNGVPALVLNGEFIVDAVSLETGANTLTAVAATRSGQTATHNVTVTRQGAPPALEADASPKSGVAPLNVTLQYKFASPAAIQSLSVDFDGDGTTDLTTTNPQTALQHTYATPGLYLARLRLTDSQGSIHTAETAIVVYDAAAMDTVFTSLWSNINAALTVGDVSTALTFLTTGARVKYEPVFTRLLPYMPAIIASYSPLQRVTLSGDIGEYAIMRIIDGQLRLFLVYFIQDAHGVWRLEGM